MVHRVLVAVDGTAASNAALEIACALADNYEAALGLITVLEPDEVSDELIEAAQVEGLIDTRSTYSEMYAAGYGAYTASPTFNDMARAEKAERMATIMAQSISRQAEAFSRNKPFKAVKTFITSGDPASAILRIASENQADIIIMGHDQQGRVESLFKGSVAEKVQREADCPVLIYCHPKPS